MLFLAEEYRHNWRAALDAAGANPAHRLDALIRADFNPSICTPAKLSAWCSFWGEAQSRPMHQERCGSNDEIYNTQLEAICATLMAGAGIKGDAVRVGRVLRVTIEGVWLDLMTMNTPYDRDEALATVFCCAQSFFPKHFSSGGFIG